MKLKLFLSLYNLAWLAALPVILLIGVLRPINRQRFGLGMPKGPYDLWIHAASVGEARLALKILSDLPEDTYPKIIISTNTVQGMETIKESACNKIELICFPFDILPIWLTVLTKIQPNKILLLETEIWPALLYACRIKSIPVTIGNARMSLKSFCRYYPLASMLKELKPDAVLPVSQRDQDRFARIFEGSSFTRMPNIKFDIISSSEPLPYVKNPLSMYFKSNQTLIVLGSIRREEESCIQWLVRKIAADHPRTTVALFPRHMNRIQAWKEFLEWHKISWVIRSELSTDRALPKVILWDVFGELIPAYALAKSAYVGGSLVPCGGQNFLEPLSQGIVPCIGPFWDNFHWVGMDILHSGLVCQVDEVSKLYLKLIRPSFPARDKVAKNFHAYIDSKRGGTSILIDVINNNYQS